MTDFIAVLKAHPDWASSSPVEGLRLVEYLISSTFVWAETREGVEYWAEVSEKLEQMARQAELAAAR